jgi:hypothetical protein
MHEQRFRVAHAHSLAFGVDRDPLGHFQIGRAIDVHVAIAGEVFDNRHFGFGGHASDVAGVCIRTEKRPGKLFGLRWTQDIESDLHMADRCLALDEAGDDTTLDGMSVTDDEAQVESRRVQEGLAQERSTLLVPPVEVVDVEDELVLRDEGQKLTQVAAAARRCLRGSRHRPPDLPQI